MKTLKVASAYSVIALFSVAVVILLIIVVDLCRKLSLKHKNKAKQKELQFFLLITIIAVICFEITLILIIVVVVQIILIDAHALHEHADWFKHVYFQSFKYTQYLIAIFDTLGHLCVVLVFIARFQIVFRQNTLFKTHTTLITMLYTCLLVLFSVAVIIIILIVINHTVTEIIIIEVIWEVAVDFMCLWILYLFISKLYQLLKLSLKAHINVATANPKKQLIDQLIEATKATITESKSRSSKLKTGNNTSKKLEYTMTIDGMKVDAIWQQHSRVSKHVTINTINNNTKSAEQSPDPSYKIHDGEQTECKSHYHTELTVNTLQRHDDKSDNERSDNEHTDKEIEPNYENKNKQASATIDLIGVMTKTTLLVTITVIVSVVGVIGNIFVELEEMKLTEKHDISIEELWADVLPVIDCVITSLMLYLQFNFSHKVYRFFFKKIDVWFLSNCLKCIECWWKREFKADVDQARLSSVNTHSTRTKTLEISTKSNEIIR